MSTVEVLVYYVTPNIVKDIDLYMSIRHEIKLYGIDYSRVWLNFKNQKHRICGPSYLLFWIKTGKMASGMWYRNDEPYRATKPFIIWYHIDGQLEEERWGNNEYHYHRVGAPAKICYYKTGNVSTYEWWQYGDRYNEQDLVSIVKYDESGNVTEALFCLPDTELSRITHPDTLNRIQEMVVQC